MVFLQGPTRNLKPGDTCSDRREDRGLASGLLPAAPPQDRRSRARGGSHPRHLRPVRRRRLSAGPFRGFALRLRASLFGYNAPDPKALHTDIQTPIRRRHRWRRVGVHHRQQDHLSRCQLPANPSRQLARSLTTGRASALHGQGRGGGRAGTLRDQRQEHARGTRQRQDLGEFRRRKFPAARRCLRRAKLEFSQRPITDPVVGDAIVLDRIMTAPDAGRPLFVRGKRARVRVVGSGLSFASVDGSMAKTLAPDGVLTLMAGPIPVAPGAAQKVSATARRRWRRRAGHVVERRLRLRARRQGR